MGRWKENHTLAGYFVRVLCATFLPLGILTVVVAGIVVGIADRRMLDSYENDLDSSMALLEANLEVVEKELDQFVIDYLAELTSESEYSEITNYEMIQRLGRIQEVRSFSGVAYLFDRGNGSFHLKYNYDDYQFSQMEDFRDKMLTRGFPQGTSRGWNLYYFDETCFFVRSYSYEKYDLGFLVDMNRYLEDQEYMETLDASAAYVGDDVRILEIRNGAASQYRDGGWQELLASAAGDCFLSWEDGDMGVRLAVRIPRLTFFFNLWGYFAVLVFIVALEIIFLIIFWRMVKKRVVASVQRMNEAMDFYARNSEQPWEDSYRITGIEEGTSVEFRRMYENFNEMAEELEKGRRREEQLYSMTLDNLRLRMNPHMLMNSFNLIYSMAQVKNCEGIQEFALCLVDYFRYILRENREMVTVRQEMEFVQSYLKVQKIRFPGRFSCVYNMEEEAAEALIPSLLIENFVENAVKYAMIPGKIVEILINIRKEDGRLLISVTDTGRGIRPEAMRAIRAKRRYVDAMGNEHIGIYNCREWMDYYYRGQAVFKVTSTPGEGTQIWMEMPFTRRDQDEITDRG